MGNEVTLTGTVEMTVRAEPLFNLVKNYTNALRFVVNEILRNPSKYGKWRYIKKTKRIKWEQDIKKIHEFYETLKRRFNLPPKFAVGCEREASMIAKSVINNKKNKRRKCIIRNYRARCGYQSYSIKFEGKKCYLRLQGFGEFEVNGFNKKWLDKYKDWKFGDLIMKIHEKVIKLYITLKKVVEIANPSEKAVAVDMNFSEIVVGNDETEARFGTPLQRIMHLKKNHIEKTQKKYNKKWLHIKRIRKAISRWWRRINGITNDFIKQISRKIVLFAKEKGFDTIVLEDLNGLRDGQAKLNKPWRERFTFFSYKRLQEWIEWQAKKEGLAVIYINPKNSSRTCPKCMSLNTKFESRKLICKNCGFTMDRDSVAVRNLVNKWLGVLGCAV